MAMGKLLWEVKGGGQGQAISKMDVQAAADGILQPLMDLLDGRQFMRKLLMLEKFGCKENFPSFEDNGHLEICHLFAGPKSQEGTHCSGERKGRVR